MPFCDRPAPYACFDEEPADGLEPGPFRWDVPDPQGPPALALKPGGPVRVAGPVAIVYGETPLPPSYTVFGTVDDATVDLVQGVADDGSTPELDGAPNTPVDLESVVAE